MKWAERTQDTVTVHMYTAFQERKEKKIVLLNSHFPCGNWSQYSNILCPLPIAPGICLPSYIADGLQTTAVIVIIFNSLEWNNHIVYVHYPKKGNISYKYCWADQQTFDEVLFYLLGSKTLWNVLDSFEAHICKNREHDDEIIQMNTFNWFSMKKTKKKLTF